MATESNVAGCYMIFQHPVCFFVALDGCWKMKRREENESEREHKKERTKEKAG
jgi:hypothetical protein